MKKAIRVCSVLLVFSLAIGSGCGSNNTKENKIPQDNSYYEDSAAVKGTTDETHQTKKDKSYIDTLEANAKLKTIENMKTAFRDEVTATAKYAAYSKKAAEEGYPPVALLYKAVSIAESIQANNHKEVLQETSAAIPILIPAFVVKTTKENLHNDIDNEANEARSVYPSYLKVAEEANNQLAHTSILYAMETEKKHKIFFEKALGDINSNTLKTMPSIYFVCPVCGNTYEATAPKRCDFSFTPRDKFIKVSAL